MRAKSELPPVRRLARGGLQRGQLALPAASYRRTVGLLRAGQWLLSAVTAALAFRLALGHELFLIGVLLFAFIGFLAALRHWQRSVRRRFIRNAQLPSFLAGKLCGRYPNLGPREAELVLQGLRQFFLAHQHSGRRFVAMPSRVVDSAWHEFILHTRAYARWCDTAFGRLLHHSPAEVLGDDPRRNDGLRRSWYWACKEEGIDPRRPSRLPLLFALDRKFDIPGGFSYVPDCRAADRHQGSGAHCGTSFGSEGGASGDAGSFGGSESAAGGDGCGGDGGCGGGGD